MNGCEVGLAGGYYPGDELPTPCMGIMQKQVGALGAVCCLGKNQEQKIIPSKSQNRPSETLSYPRRLGKEYMTHFSVGLFSGITYFLRLSGKYCLLVRDHFLRPFIISVGLYTLYKMRSI